MSEKCYHCGDDATYFVCKKCNDSDAELYDAAAALIDDVKKRYSLESSAQFQCPYMRRIAEILEDW